ncbi:MAG TPA: thiamine phosphate synthase [Polyangia bacterium]|nr:thiamine phosphate synthase [Polyangia bacterium]
MSSAAPRLYLITDRRATNGRPLVDVVRAALAGAPAGAVAVSLREKDLDARALLDLARALRAVTRDAGATLYVNDRADVALAAEADGVHLGTRALAPDEVARLAPKLAIAVSTHGRAEVEAAARARDAGADVRFAVFGPIWDTPSKRALGSPVGLEALRGAAGLGLPLLALGGVTAERAASCRAAGAVGVAAIRAICSAEDPSAAVAALLAGP